MRDDIRLDEPPGSGGSAWKKGRVVALFAIVHGSMAAPAAYRRLATELGRRGQRTVLVELPVDRPELTGTDYARLVAQQLDAALAQDGIQQEPVVVVAHSASGLLLPLVPSFHPVAHLVYLAAGVPQPGMTLDEQLQAEPDMLNPAWVGVDPFQDHQAARRFLFHDCDEATAHRAIATQSPWYPEGLYGERYPLVAFPPVPSTSIVCAGDRVIQPPWSRRAARDRLHAQVIELPGGHCPHVSRPALLAEALISATASR
jgi:pimeloyl-ACP methyl ester carboxylesterase